MTAEDLKELDELRAYRKLNEGRALNRAFARLEQLIGLAAYDPLMTTRSFRVIAECLICLREELEGKL